MKNPELVVLAAGMGSRYGGLKQIDAIDEYGHVIIDYSIHDAIEAGFRDVTFIIKKAIEEDFRALMDSHLAGKGINVKYVYQELDMLPEGFTVPAERKKPWGTAHAIACCRGIVDAPFAVINADDYYGKDAFRKIYAFLKSIKEGESAHYAMVGYKIKNTVTEQGGVSRGVCVLDGEGKLAGITECAGISVDAEGIYYTPNGKRVSLDPETVVSMNLWGFPSSYIDECYNRFSAFLEENLSANPEKCEFYMPTVIAQLLKEDAVSVTVLDSCDKWYGVTYKEDKPKVMEAFKEMCDSGIYPKGF